ncbi:glycoside hydrolase family 130 protein [Aureliella helgolandensis]|uniref:Beta-1,4-mannooligosaccharide phosphorylase n=1 Tax=Aureliella helgolandensis TaxID=2527968 RepID=A0A518G8L8_9BACT|nr:glycoside hydrolase family 130 protein [Aureliella helgolandensis]QDV24933.1 Beta-1,4-mannooligosaccharide phosphorylase [Aureliella helgolandensis]
MQVNRTGLVLSPNKQRVVLRPFDLPTDDRILRVIARVSALTESDVDALLGQVLVEFHGRHQDPQAFFERRFQKIRHHLLTDIPPSKNRRLLLGAYFTQEYALESAALFNPSLVWHPDQSNLAKGSRRFAMSLRAVGEGHISSIVFRSGTITHDLKIKVDEPVRFVTTPSFVPDTRYENDLFRRKLVELGLGTPFIFKVLSALDQAFTLEQLEKMLKLSLREQRSRHAELAPLVEQVVTLAKSNYEILYTPDHELSERVIFPFSPTETNGIEDARFVQFQESDGSSTYYATYSAYDGKMVLPQLLETPDFLRFKMHTLNGPAVSNKGMALFPRKINGHYVMLGRQDGEHLYLMYSDMLYFWYSKQLIIKPNSPWEYVQMGNCGSPIETKDGWLVLTHGVGPMRKYCIGAMLLDLEDPSRTIARLQVPLITPNEIEREGYVPNVVYTCGAIVHNDHLVIPYAMSDYATTFATIALDELVAAMT